MRTDRIANLEDVDNTNTSGLYKNFEPNVEMADNSNNGPNLQDAKPIEWVEDAISKVRYSRSRASDSRVSIDAPLSTSSPSNNSFDMQQIAASLEDKMTIKMKQMMNEMKALVFLQKLRTTIKAVEEVVVTCGSNHNFNHCPLTRGGNDFPVFHDNIQQFQQTAAVGNFLQRNQPSNLASQMKPPGFNQPNVQNNQNRYQGNNFNSNQNRGGNFNQNRPNNQGAVFQPPTNQPPTYQTPTSHIQGVLKTDFENYVKANDAVLKNVQNQGQNLQNQMANVTSLLISLCDNFKNSASTFECKKLFQGQPKTNPRRQLNAINTYQDSGKTLGKNLDSFVPSYTRYFNSQKEPVQNIETSTEKDAKNPNEEYTAHVTSPILPSPLLDSDSPFTAELSVSVTLSSLGNEDKVFNPGILVYHAIHDKNLITMEETLKENISSGTLLVFKELSFLLPPPEPPDECLNFEPILVMKNVVLNEAFYQSNVEDVNSITIII
ncbi:hypothetical protein Tco_0256468 [Tanacetum coccineum]